MYADESHSINNLCI